MRLHPLALALLLTGISAQSQATDLLQAYELARQSDPQLSAAESQKNAQGENIVQSRSALLPQISAEAPLWQAVLRLDQPDTPRLLVMGPAGLPSGTLERPELAERVLEKLGVRLPQAILEAALESQASRAWVDVPAV